RMGGLRKFLPVTAATFIVAWLAIAGVPPFSGFFSKGDVLMNAYARSPALYAAGLLTALLTAYYLGRIVFLTFSRPQRGRTSGPEEVLPHESPTVMLIPLVILAIASFAAGALDLPYGHYDYLTTWLDPVFGSAERVLTFSSSAKDAFEVAD